MSEISEPNADALNSSLEAATLIPTTPDLDPAALLKDISLKIEKLEGRQRQIQAQINLPYTMEQVWQVLTDYESLAEFVPNLVKSQRLNHPEGKIRIEQIGVQNALFLNFSARVVLDMEENFPHALRFQMVEGDFKDFSGCWNLQQWLHSKTPGTRLTYTLIIWPKRTMPVIAIERRLGSDLPYNLLAIRKRLDEISAC